MTFYLRGPREKRMWPKGGENTTWKQKGRSGRQEAEEPSAENKGANRPKIFP